MPRENKFFQINNSFKPRSNKTFEAMLHLFKWWKHRLWRRLVVTAFSVELSVKSRGPYLSTTTWLFHFKKHFVVAIKRCSKYIYMLNCLFFPNSAFLFNHGWNVLEAIHLIYQDSLWKGKVPWNVHLQYCVVLSNTFSRTDLSKGCTYRQIFSLHLQYSLSCNNMTLSHTLHTACKERGKKKKECSV